MLTQGLAEKKLKNIKCTILNIQTEMSVTMHLNWMLSDGELFDKSEEWNS